MNEIRLTVYQLNKRLKLQGLKKCSKCGEIKPFDQYCHCNKIKSGMNAKCKRCLYGERKTYLENNPGKAKKFNGKWDKEHPEIARNRSRAWREKNKERFSASVRKWRNENKERNKILIKNWCDKNRERRNISVRERRKRPDVALSLRMGGLLRASLKNGKGKRGHHWENILGYTLGDLKKHIERRFLPGMSWENMNLWEIDHIIPLAAHNYETEDDYDFQRAWSLKNLRPLWKQDNRKKGARLCKPFQPALCISVDSK